MEAMEESGRSKSEREDLLRRLENLETDLIVGESRDGPAGHMRGSNLVERRASLQEELSKTKAELDSYIARSKEDIES